MIIIVVVIIGVIIMVIIVVKLIINNLTKIPSATEGERKTRAILKFRMARPEPEF